MSTATMPYPRQVRSFPSTPASIRSPFSPSFYIPSRAQFQPPQFSFSPGSSPSSVKLAFTLNSDDQSIFRDKPQQILVVVDAAKEVNTDALVWTLDLVAKPGDTVTFAGILPWLCIPLLLKRRAELRMIEEATREGDYQLKSMEFVRIQNAYKARGVNLEIVIESGFPPRDIALKLARKIDAHWIICYRCLNKKIDQSLLFQELGGNNIVFLKSKDEGSVSFAAKSPTISPITMLDCIEEPGFCSPQGEIVDLGPVASGLKASNHVTIGECLRKKAL